MKICGFQRVSLIDYPGKICSVVFISGCNMRCPFCHNPELVFEEYGKLKVYEESEILQKLEKSRGFVEAVEITGGEPTLWPRLAPFIKSCKEMGFLVKLDTNGSNPLTLGGLLLAHQLDYVAMDLKAPLEQEKYGNASGTGLNRSRLLDNVKTSIRILMDSGIDYEFRTTVVPGLVEPEDVLRIANAIKDSKAYYLQQFRTQKTLDPNLRNTVPYKIEELDRLCDRILKLSLVQKCEVRGKR